MRKPKFLAMTLAAALVAGAVFEAPVMTARAEETAGSASETVSPGNSGTTVSPGNSGTTVTPGDESGSQTPSTPGEEGGSQTPSTPGDESGSQTPSTPGEESGSQTPSTPGDESGTTDVELIAPTNLTWTTLSYPSENNRWGVTLTVPNWEELSKLEGDDVYVYVRVDLCKGDDTVACDLWRADWIEGENLETDFSNWIFETGDYYLTAYEYRYGIDDNWVWGEQPQSDKTVSAVQHYEAPAQRLGTVTDIIWDTEEIGVFYFTPVAGDVDHYGVSFYKETDSLWAEDGMECVGGTSVIPGHDALREDGRYRADVSHCFAWSGAGVYHATVQAYSRDIDVCANGYESEYSVPLDTYARSEEVSGKIADAIAANAGNPVAAAAAVRTAAGSVNEAATQMQLSAEILNRISELETAYNDAQGITVNQTVSPEAAARGVSAEGISIVGAGFNAADNSTVTLNIGVPSREETLPTGYRRGVQLDISLDGAQTDADGRLLMPVTITMPAPEGVDLRRLTLFHYHNGSRNSVAFRYDSAANTITFTVTSFSTFLFAEEGTDETQPDGGNTPSGDAVQPDNGSRSGSGTSSNGTASNNTASGASSASSVTAEKKEPAPLTYVVQRGDNMYRIARKHGLTLAQLVALNPQIKNPARIYAGQVLIVGYTDGETASAANAEYDIVKKGDSLYRIAARNGLKLIELKTLNPKLFAQKFIFAGQKVRVK